MNRILPTVIAVAFLVTSTAHALADDDIVKLNKNGQLVPPGNMNADLQQDKPRKIGKAKATAPTQPKKKAAAEEKANSKHKPGKKRTIKKGKSAKPTDKPKADTTAKSTPTKKPAKKRTIKKPNPKPKTAATKNLAAKTAPRALSSRTSVTLKRLPMMPGPGELPPKKMTKSSPRMLNKKTINDKALNNVRKELKAKRDFANNAPKRIPQSSTAKIANNQKSSALNKTTKRHPNTTKGKVAKLPNTNPKAANNHLAKNGHSPRKVSKSGKLPNKSTPKVAGNPLKNSGKKLASATKKPGIPKTKGLSKTAKVGVVSGITAGGIGIAAIKKAYDANKANENGNGSKTQLAKAHATNATETAAALYKLKKLNPSTLLLNDAIGTDPLSLGVDAVGDLLNGTSNAKQSLQGMQDSWNQSLVKESFTDPKSAAIRVGNDLKNTGGDIKNLATGIGDTVDARIQEAGKDINKGLNTVKDKAQKITDSAKTSVNKVKSAATTHVNKAKTNITKAKKKVTGFVGGLFKKKK